MEAILLSGCDPDGLITNSSSEYKKWWICNNGTTISGALEYGK